MIFPPTLGTIVGDDFYFVANSHWNRFDANNELPGGLTGPIVLKLSLRGGGADEAIYKTMFQIASLSSQ